MNTPTKYALRQLCSAAIIGLVTYSVTLSAGTIPKKISYEVGQMTNRFHLTRGLAPLVSNVLYVVEHTREACPYLRNADYVAQESVDLAKICDLQLLPYLVTPADSSAVTRVIHACAAQSGSNTELLRTCGRMLIETTFDIPGGIAILQSIVEGTQAPLEERIRAANTLLYNGVPAGYTLMIEAFDGTNRAAHFAAENLLLTYDNYLAGLHQTATNGAAQLTTLNGTPVNLSEVIAHIKHDMRMPFVTNDIDVVEEPQQ